RASHVASHRQELGRRAASLIDDHAEMVRRGLVRVEEGFATAHDREAAAYALRILLAAMGGAEQLPSAAKADALLLRLAASPFRATLARAVVDVRRTGIFLYRERRSLPPRQTGDPGIW